MIALLCFAAGVSCGVVFGAEWAWRKQRQAEQVEVRPRPVSLKDTLE